MVEARNRTAIVDGNRLAVKTSRAFAVTFLPRSLLALRARDSFLASTPRTPRRSSLATPSAPPSLAGMRVLVTGASSGIGRAIAIAAARAGADVAVTYRLNERGGRDVAREIEA